MKDQCLSTVHKVHVGHRNSVKIVYIIAMTRDTPCIIWMDMSEICVKQCMSEICEMDVGGIANEDEMEVRVVMPWFSPEPFQVQSKVWGEPRTRPKVQFWVHCIDLKCQYIQMHMNQVEPSIDKALGVSLGVLRMSWCGG
jgi:hypothetical protein